MMRLVHELNGLRERMSLVDVRYCFKAARQNASLPCNISQPPYHILQLFTTFSSETLSETLEIRRYICGSAFAFREESRALRRARKLEVDYSPARHRSYEIASTMHVEVGKMRKNIMNEKNG